MTSWEPPVASAAASAPSFDDWLTDLSSSCPTSVTTPTLRGVRAADGSVDGASDAGALGGATDAGALGAVDAAPGPQAATMMAIPANRVRPKRFCMCSPPSRVPRGPERARPGTTPDPNRPLLPGRHRL